MQNATTHQNEKARRYERKPYSQIIDYSLSVSESREHKWLNMKGKAVDISEAGIGIQTDYPLAPGHMLWFNGGIEEKAGFVRWCEKLDNEYRAGIELDGKRIKHLDEATDIFNKQLQEIEKRCSDPEKNPDRLLNDITMAISDVLRACENFEREVQDKDIIRDARVRFHGKTNAILSKSYCINRARTWPQGYQGDYKTLEIIYKNMPLSENIGYFLDLYSLNLSLSIGVRNRIKKLEEILRDEISVRKLPSVLNIACGSCREIFSLAPDIEKTGAKVTCIDLDNDALSFAANRLSYTSISPLSSNQVTLRKYNALRMFDDELNMMEFGKQDIIYSVGLFDYVNDDFFVRLLGTLYRLLNPGGKLIAVLPDAEQYRSQDYHWIVDWDGLLQRSKKDYDNLLCRAGIPESALTATREESGVFIFYIATK